MSPKVSFESITDDFLVGRYTFPPDSVPAIRIPCDKNSTVSITLEVTIIVIGHQCFVCAWELTTLRKPRTFEHGVSCSIDMISFHETISPSPMKTSERIHGIPSLFQPAESIELNPVFKSIFDDVSVTEPCSFRCLMSHSFTLLSFPFVLIFRPRRPAVIHRMV